jgi:hypothetical protein
LDVGSRHVLNARQVHDANIIAVRATMASSFASGRERSFAMLDYPEIANDGGQEELDRDDNAVCSVLVETFNEHGTELPVALCRLEADVKILIGRCPQRHTHVAHYLVQLHLHEWADGQRDARVWRNCPLLRLNCFIEKRIHGPFDRS